MKITKEYLKQLIKEELNSFAMQENSLDEAISKDWYEFFKEAEKLGWRVQKTNKNHFQLFAPDGKTIMSAPGTPSDWRSYHNAKAEFKRKNEISQNNIKAAATQKFTSTAPINQANLKPIKRIKRKLE